MFELIITALMSTIITWIITAIVVRYASKLGLVQHPNHRSSHTKITPHGGGVAIIISTLVFSMWLLWRDPADHQGHWIAISLSLIVAIKGLVDDIHPLSAKLRLFIQFLVSSALLATLYSLPVNGLDNIDHFPLWLSFVLVLIAGVWWLNLYNFMDGIDGLAASQAIFMLSGAALLIAINTPKVMATTTWAWMVCLAAATLGFLLHNWSPAKIFMGDTGSLFLAFAIFFLALLTISQGWMNYVSWSILGAVFIIDATMTLIRRALSKQRVTEAHRSHAYQRLSRHWGAHSKVTFLTICINVFWLLPLAYLSLSYPLQGYYYLFLAYFPLVLGVGLLDNILKLDND